MKDNNLSSQIAKGIVKAQLILLAMGLGFMIVLSFLFNSIVKKENTNTVDNQ